MTHIVIEDYAYYTRKHFFENIELADVYCSKLDTNLTGISRLLSCRTYEMSQYKKMVKDGIEFINYMVNLETVKYHV